jgi:hypothetical protein
VTSSVAVKILSSSAFFMLTLIIPIERRCHTLNYIIILAPIIVCELSWLVFGKLIIPALNKIGKRQVMTSQQLSESKYNKEKIANNKVIEDKTNPFFKRLSNTAALSMRMLLMLVLGIAYANPSIAYIAYQVYSVLYFLFGVIFTYYIWYRRTLAKKNHVSSLVPNGIFKIGFIAQIIRDLIVFVAFFVYFFTS